jgi:peptide/nickel transport system permease protein
MRVTDVFLSVPPLALALAVTAAFRPDLGSAMVAISFTWWPWFTRLVYGEVLSRREEPYVEAARALGQHDRVILVREILPNVVSPVVVKASLDVSFVILLGSGLAFLGVGAQEPTPDWGRWSPAGGRSCPPTGGCPPCRGSPSSWRSWDSTCSGTPSATLSTSGTGDGGGPWPSPREPV